MPVTDYQKQKLSQFGIEIVRERKPSVELKLNQTRSVKMSRALFDKLVVAACSSTKPNCDIPKIHFGVELEFVGSNKESNQLHFDREMRRIFGPAYYNAHHYCHNDGTSWILGADSSIRYTLPNDNSIKGYELSSNKITIDFSKNESLPIIQEILDLVKTALKGTVNESCGTHIHIGFPIEKLYKDRVESLLDAYSNMESLVFDPIVPVSRRRNKYCKKTTSFIGNKYQKLSARYCRFTYSRECKSFHLECRQLEGTLDYDTIMAWTKLQSYIIYDIISNIDDSNYIESIKRSNIFDILFRYNFDLNTISFFIERVVMFKSKTIQQSVV